MTIRRATLDDASSLAAISIEVWIGTYLKRGVSAFFADYALNTFRAEKLAQLITDDRQTILVLEEAEGIVGYIRLATASPAPVPGCSDTEIATLYLQLRHHGKGIGKALFEAALEECRAKGIASLWLTTNAENDPAIGFYLAQGFQRDGETLFEIEDQKYLNHVYTYQIE